MKYENYIFDLYGTLVDIKNDEMEISLWKKLAKLYSAYGAIYKPKQLRKAYIKLDREERDILKKNTGCEYPEIKLERVFLRLLKEAPSGNVRVPENEAVWSEFMANAFRTLSRKYIKLYSDTLETLDKLKKKGCRLYLLSNAQAIFTKPEISMLGLDRYFDKMYISSDYGIMKPDKEFLLRLINDEELDKSKSVMVGNEIRSDVKIADLCGVDGILINSDGLNKKEIKKQAKEYGIKNTFKVVNAIKEI